jgi:hypothetical protein
LQQGRLLRRLSECGLVFNIIDEFIMVHVLLIAPEPEPQFIGRNVAAVHGPHLGKENDMTQILVRRVITSLMALSICATSAAAWALTPTVVWQRVVPTGKDGNRFSADGTALLVATSTGFELRRSSDGVVQSTVTLPAASLTYEYAALSPDKQFVALALYNSAIGTIEIWRVSNSTLVRTITTDAIRSFKALDYSSTGLIATQERFAYGGGGYLRVHNASTGALVKKIGPVVRNSNPVTVAFSADGKYLAGADNFNVGDNSLSVYRTSDSSVALKIGIGTYSGLLAWSPDSTSLWSTAYQQVHIPDGAIVQTVPDTNFVISGFTPNNRSALVTLYANGQLTGTIEFVRTSDASAQVVYALGASTQASTLQVASTGTLFTYCVVSTDFTTVTLVVARVPAL